MATLVLQPEADFSGPQIYKQVAELLPPYAWPRFLRIQVSLQLGFAFWFHNGPAREARAASGGPDLAARSRQFDFPSAQEQLEMTETFKQKRFRLVEEGFDPTRIMDPLFVLDVAARTYAPLTPDIWKKIAAGELRL